MEKGHAPSFLRGTFIWDELGYALATSPPVDLLAPAALSSTDPWIVVASVLEHAKAGNFRAVPALRRLLTADVHPVALRASVELLGNVGTDDAFAILAWAMADGPDWLRVEATGGARRAGALNLAPMMLDAWRRVSSRADRDSISLMLSRTLEEKSGPISAWSERPETEYQELVLRTVRELAERFHSDRAPVWRGKLFGVVSSARYAHDALTSGKQSASALGVLFLDYRQKLEAATGLNCSGFFKEGTFQPLTTAAFLEELLASSNLSNFEEGTRYFFGRKIPIDPTPR